MILLILLLLIVFVVIYNVNIRPDYNKGIELVGLIDNVEVYRDSVATPHVYAMNEEVYIVKSVSFCSRKTDMLMRALPIPENRKRYHSLYI